MNCEYKIVSKQDILKNISDLRAQLIELDDFTMAKVYKGDNDKYYLIPAVGVKGIESDQKKTIDSIILSKHIPIEEEKPNPFILNQESILNLEKSAVKIISNFSKKYELDINLKDYSFNYHSLNKNVNQFKGQERYNLFMFPLGLIIGEKIRFETKAHWTLEKRYSYNPYFEPFLIIESSKTKFDPWYFLTRKLLSSARFDFQEIIQEILLSGKDF